VVKRVESLGDNMERKLWAGDPEGQNRARVVEEEEGERVR